MGSVHFKLSISNGLTRRISFPTRPSWIELAARIHTLYYIPLSRLGVSYVDSDGDEVTLSSEEELRDFYDTSDAVQLIKFRVVELGSLRNADKVAEAASPPQSSTRNTFGGPAPLVFEVDHDWEPIPLGGLFIPSLGRDVDTPHAFVEVVDDEMEKEKESTTDIDGHLVEEKGKGKGRDLRASVAEDFSSSASMIGEETPIKPPIHVQVHGLRRMDSGTFGPPPAVSTPARESATPTPGTLPATPLENRGDVTGSFPDPPTPELAAFRDPDISVSNDLASLLDSLNLMFLEHPEVGQHLRVLFRNVGNGSYWNAQRNSMARVAEDIQRVARDAQTAVAVGAQEMHRTMQEARQQAQQEAARRVTEAVGNILRVFGAGGAEPASGTHISSSSSTGAPHASNTHPSGAFPYCPPQWGLPSQPPPPAGVAHPHPSSITPLFQPEIPQPISMTSPPPPVMVDSAPVWNQFKPFQGPLRDIHNDGPSLNVGPPPEVSYYTASANRGARPSVSELKTSLEAAKASYKAEKERYRREQETRRRERQLSKEGAVYSPTSPGAQRVEGHSFDSMGPSDAETSHHPVPAATEPPLRQIISNARGGFPQLEMVNLPRSPTKQRGDRTHYEDDKSQHVDTVVERLEGMGFHESTYPTLRTVVESHLPADGTRITKDMEDDVMSEVLEKILETSGSGMHSAL